MQYITKQIAVLCAACVLTAFSCTKQETASAPQVPAPVSGGSVQITSEVAGMVLVDGAETGKRIKAQGTALVEQVADGLTEVAVKMDDGAVVKAADMVLVKTGEIAEVHIAQTMEKTPQATALQKTAAAPPSTPVRENTPASAATPPQKVDAAPAAEDAQAPLNRGKDYLSAGRYDEAIAELDQALAINHNLSEAWFYRGAAYSGKRDNARAIADFSAALRIDPNYASAYNNRGIAYHEEEEYDRAIADYTAALRINPNDAATYYNRGLAYALKGNNDPAIVDYTAALRINPNDADTYFNRGLMY